MKRSLLVLAIFAALATATLAQPATGRVEQKFAPGGHVKLELGGGDYDLKAGASDKIVITYHTEYPEQMNNVDARINTFPGAAKVQVHGPHSNFHATIEVPARSDVSLRLAAGDLRVT